MSELNNNGDGPRPIIRICIEPDGRIVVMSVLKSVQEIVGLLEMAKQVVFMSQGSTMVKPVSTPITPSIIQ